MPTAKMVAVISALTMIAPEAVTVESSISARTTFASLSPSRRLTANEPPIATAAAVVCPAPASETARAREDRGLVLRVDGHGARLVHRARPDRRRRVRVDPVHRARARARRRDAAALLPGLRGRERSGHGERLDAARGDRLDEQPAAR